MVTAGMRDGAPVFECRRAQLDALVDPGPGSGVVVVGAAGSGTSFFARSLARRWAGDRVLVVRGRGGDPGRDPARWVAERVPETLPPEAVVVVDDVDHLDDRLCAELIDAVLGRRHRVVFTARDRGRLPESCARLLAGGGVDHVRLGPIDETDARAYIDAAAGGRVESESALRLHERSEGSMLVLSLFVGFAVTEGALHLRQGLRVLEPGWQPDLAAWTPVLGSRVPRSEGSEEADVLALLASIGSVHLDELSRMGLASAAEALAERGELAVHSALAAGWGRTGIVVELDALRRCALLAAGGPLRRTRVVQALCEVVEPSSYPDEQHFAIARSLLTFGAGVDPAGVLLAYAAGERAAHADELLAFVRAAAVHVGLAGVDPADETLVEAVHALTAALSRCGEPAAAFRLAAPWVDAGHLPTLVLVAMLYDEDPAVYPDPDELLDRVDAVAEPGSDVATDSAAVRLLRRSRFGDPLALDELRAAVADPRLSHWYRAALAGLTVHLMCALGRCLDAFEVCLPLVDVERRDALSARAQSTLYYACLVAIDAAGHQPSTLREWFPGERVGWLRIPVGAAHSAAAGVLTATGCAAEAMDAYRQSLAALEYVDPHRLRPITLAMARRTLLQLAPESVATWSDLTPSVTTGEIRGARVAELRAYHVVSAHLESGDTQVVGPVAELVDTLREAGLRQVELTVLHWLWRHGCDVDTERMALLAARCQGDLAAGIAAQVRGVTDDAAAAEAVRIFATGHRYLYAAEAAMMRASALEAGGMDAAAAEVSAQAIALVDELGPVFTPMLGLRSSGDPVLSGREREIAYLVARGASNREVAGTLSLSPRTVDAHMARIMAKLGIRSRRQLRHPVPDLPPALSTGRGTRLVQRAGWPAPGAGHGPPSAAWSRPAPTPR